MDTIKCIIGTRKNQKDNEDLIMRITTKNITFIAATIVLIIISAFFITKTVRGEVDHEMIACEKYYQVLEQEYRVLYGRNLTLSRLSEDTRRIEIEGGDRIADLSL